MDFKFKNALVGPLIAQQNKQFVIPRYQRDYSWGEKENIEFSDDIFKCISVDKNKLIANEYFIGTILVKGNLEDNSRQLEVIDGQQRLTTITIILSVLCKKFMSIDEESLCDKLWDTYIVKSTDDDETFFALQNDTLNDYFQFLVQSKKVTTRLPIDEEHLSIKAAFDYYDSKFSQDNIYPFISKINSNINRDFSYKDILIVMRKQLLDCRLICISTEDKKSSSSIFEILNAKGKKLEPIDLIKNQIFDYLDNKTPDEANQLWLEIKQNLSSRNVVINLSEFYRHFWISKYKKSTKNNLYSSFKTIKKEEYLNFLEDIKIHSSIYNKIVNPIYDDVQNKQQFLYVVDAYRYISDYFGIKQARIALMAINYHYNVSKLINSKTLKKIVNYLHHFHFVYNSLCAKPTNALEGLYSNFSIALYKAETVSAANILIDKLISDMNNIFPSYEEFKDNFIKLEYSAKKNTNSNLSCKYVLNIIEIFESNLNAKPSHGTIEHIYPESKTNKVSLNIGNLILLEDKINEEADDKDFDNKVAIYKKSKFANVNTFVSTYEEFECWGDDEILLRANNLADYFYTKILKKSIPE